MGSVFDELLDKRVERAARRALRRALLPVRPPLVNEARSLVSLARADVRAEVSRWAGDPPPAA